MHKMPMHYFSDDHSKIIDQIHRREKKTINNFMDELSLNCQMRSAFDDNKFLYAQHASLDDFMETVVIKNGVTFYVYIRYLAHQSNLQMRLG